MSVTGLALPVERLLFGLASAYVFAAIQRFLLPRNSPTLANLYSIAAGSAIFYYNFGTDLVHPFACVVGTWVLMRLSPQSPQVLAVVGFVFNFGYLLAAYYFYATDSYDINWTTPGCVLTLRLIGFCFDRSDGLKMVQSGSDTAVGPLERTRGLKTLPSLLSLLGFCFHYSGMLIGPQFNFVVYGKFLSDTLLVDENQKPIPVHSLPSPVWPALQSLLVGLVYLAVVQAGNMVVPPTLVADAAFMSSQSFLMRVVWITLWGRLQMMQYTGLWKYAEGAGIMSGLGASYDPETKQLSWDRLANVSLLRYESACNLREVVGAFNTNTNAWVVAYIRDRVKVLPNVSLEMANFSCLIFLAIWHGFHPGYVLAFMLEFLELEAEKRISLWAIPLKKKIFGAPTDKSGVRFHDHTGGFLGYTFSLCGYWLRSIGIGHGLVPFVFFTVPLTHQIWSSTYYLPHVFCIVVVLFDFIFRKFNRSSTSPSKSSSTTQTKTE